MTQTIVERRLAPPLDQPAPLLDVRGLTVATTRGAELVQDITFSVTAGSSLGIVGESGSGKTMTAMAVAGLLPPTVAVTAGSIRVAADPDVVWALLADPTQMARWSPENTGARTTSPTPRPLTVARSGEDGIVTEHLLLVATRGQKIAPTPGDRHPDVP